MSRTQVKIPASRASYEQTWLANKALGNRLVFYTHFQTVFF